MLIEKFIEKKQIKEAEAENIKKEFREFQGTEEEFLLQKKLLNDHEMNVLKSEAYNMPSFEKIDILDVSGDVLSLIPEDSARFYKIIPLSLNGNVLDVGMVDPDDIKAQEVIDFLSRQNKIKHNTYVINNNSFKSFLKKYRDMGEEVGKALSNLEKELGGRNENVDFNNVEKKTKTEKLSEDAPIIKMVAVILRHAVDGGASDVHIEPEEKQLRIRFRMDGSLFASLFLPIHTHASIVTRIKILSNLRIDETRVPQDGRFSAKIDNKLVDFRVSTFPTKLGEKVVIRVLDPTENLRNYEEIGLSGYNLDVVKEAVKKPFGLILTTGPTGSGKTTTIYSILKELNNPDVNVVTLEDPIEYFISGVNQSQIRPEIGYDFSHGLRSVVRQDPDIIMVGEIRDEDSASLVTHAALTGHIVLSTLHTNNAIGSISRLIDMKVKPFLIPATLNLVVAQRLAHTLCPYCKEKVRPNKEVEKEIIRQMDDLPESNKKYFTIPKELFVYKPKGCPKCNMKGEKGRIGVFEVLKMSRGIEQVILEDYSTVNLAKEARKQGMITMRQDAIIKALQGIISIEEVFRITEEQKI
ncbi:MAG: type pilus assembly protein PilB [Patescibacteria group bacterium]|nr:type pilus assembly protein PilB [Patescibacteria group bacterium]